jgi:hypothetical protein
MRARRGVVLGWVAVALYAAALVAVTVTTSDSDLRPGDRPGDPSAVDDLIDAWERSRTATFVRIGTFERRSESTGAAISSEDVLVQRPPRRIHRQLGGVAGRDDDRFITCPAPPAGEPARDCDVGDPGGATYADSVDAEVAGLRSIVGGPTPVYGVDRSRDEGCFELAQLRVDPRAPFGTEARFCFDPATGAPADSEVHYEGGIVEVLVVTRIRSEVSDDDLRP